MQVEFFRYILASSEKHGFFSVSFETPCIALVDNYHASL